MTTFKKHFMIRNIVTGQLNHSRGIKDRMQSLTGSASFSPAIHEIVEVEVSVAPNAPITRRGVEMGYTDLMDLLKEKKLLGRYRPWNVGDVICVDYQGKPFRVTSTPHDYEGPFFDGPREFYVVYAPGKKKDRPIVDCYQRGFVDGINGPVSFSMHFDEDAQGRRRAIPRVYIQ